MPTLSRYLLVSIFTFFFLSDATPSFAESFLKSRQDNWNDSTEESLEKASEKVAEKVQEKAPRKTVKAPKAIEEETSLSSAAGESLEKTSLEQSSLEQTSLEQSGSDQISLDAPPKRKKKVKKYRRVASVGSGELAEEESGTTKSRTRVRSRAAKIDQNVYRIGLLTGISSLQSSSGGSGGTLLNFGLQADAQFRYWGIELDSFYGAGLGLDTAGGTGSSLSTYGIMPTLKGQYTFRSGEMKFTPKVGLGYGLFNVSQSSSDSTLTSTVKMGYGGVFAMAGFEATLVRWFMLYADFATSLSASGTSEGDLGTGAFSQALSDIQFGRLRAGGNFIIGQNVLLGAQFYQRSYSSGGTSQPQTFILGHLGLQW